ncbi:hypothetical protein NEIG_02068 [Nematocida sp. ERTm5]|nr:hypothetical protein NEIG_02068 [Nematocida sp. ERTm5]
MKIKKVNNAVYKLNIVDNVYCHMGQLEKIQFGKEQEYYYSTERVPERIAASQHDSVVRILNNMILIHGRKEVEKPLRYLNETPYGWAEYSIESKLYFLCMELSRRTTYVEKNICIAVNQKIKALNKTLSAWTQEDWDFFIEAFLNYIDTVALSPLKNPPTLSAFKELKKRQNITWFSAFSAYVNENAHTYRDVYLELSQNYYKYSCVFLSAWKKENKSLENALHALKSACIKKDRDIYKRKKRLKKERGKWQLLCNKFLGKCYYCGVQGHKAIDCKRNEST